MKKLFYPFLVLASLWLNSCQDQETKKDPAQAAPFEFALDIGEILQETKTDVFDGLCPTGDELDELAKADHLIASITIEDKEGVETTFENIELNYINIGDGQLVTDPILINIPETGQYCFNVTQVTVFNNENDDMEPIFSSMHESSQNQAWVNRSCLLPSPDICLDQDDVYQKIEVNLCVFCAFDEDPSYFGYIKWNVEFKKLICIPFAVNICDEYTGEDQVGTGSISIKSGTMVNGSFQSDGKSYGKVYFPDSPSQLTHMCITDALEKDNTEEWYRLVMKIGYRRFVGYVSVAEFLTYADNPEVTGYDPENQYIHFWFCDGKTHWFFREGSGCCNRELEFIMPEDWNQIGSIYKHWDLYYEDWMRGLPPTNEIDKHTEFVEIEGGSEFETRCSYRFVKTDTTFSRIDVIISAPTAPSYLNITLFDKGFEADTSTIRLLPVVDSLHRYQVSYEDYVDLIEENKCYFVNFKPEGDFKLEEMHIQIIDKEIPEVEE